MSLVRNLFSLLAKEILFRFWIEDVSQGYKLVCAFAKGCTGLENAQEEWDCHRDGGTFYSMIWVISNLEHFLDRQLESR